MYLIKNDLISFSQENRFLDQMMFLLFCLSGKMFISIQAQKAFSEISTTEFFSKLIKISFL